MGGLRAEPPGALEDRDPAGVRLPDEGLAPGLVPGETPEEAFFVQCDEENNPPEEREAGRLLVEVGVAPVRPTEFLVLRLAQEMQEKDEGA